MRMRAKTTVAATLLLAGSLPAGAAQFNSAYTEINLDECTILSSGEFGASWVCSGYKGVPVYIAEGDLRYFVSFGLGADKEIAAGQTPPPFNYLGETVEWRLSNASGGWKPVAAITRYFVQGAEGEPEGQVLAVTQIAPGATCQIAYVDARANPDANELAREVADNKAGSADCAEEPEIVGVFEAWER